MSLSGLQFTLTIFYFGISHHFAQGADKANLMPPPFIEVPVPTQESDRSCICMLLVSNLPLSRIVVYDFVIDPTVWCFCFLLHFISITSVLSIYDDYLQIAYYYTLTQ